MLRRTLFSVSSRICSASVRSFQFAPALSQEQTLQRNQQLLSNEQKKAEEMAKVFDVALNVSAYPEARRDETVVDDYHGTKVSAEILG